MNLLIRATNWVGDAVMSIPALVAVRRRWPSAEISILARPWVADLYRDQGLSDRLIVYDALGKHSGFSGREALAAELRKEKFDAAMLLQNAFDAAWLAWRAEIPERIGYARDARSFLLTKAVAVPKRGEIPAHEKYYYLELLRRAGWLDSLSEEPSISLRVPEKHARRAAQLLTDA